MAIATFFRLVLLWRNSTLLKGPTSCLNLSKSFLHINLKEVSTGLMVPSYHPLNHHQHMIILLIFHSVSVHLLSNLKSKNQGFMVPSNHSTTQFQISRAPAELPSSLIHSDHIETPELRVRCVEQVVLAPQAPGSTIGLACAWHEENTPNLTRRSLPVTTVIKTNHLQHSLFYNLPTLFCALILFYHFDQRDFIHHFTSHLISLNI